MIGATPAQLEALRYLAGYRMANHGIAPTVREMARALGCSPTAIKNRLDELEDCGFIRRLPSRARAIEPTVKVDPLFEMGGQLFRFIPAHRIGKDG